MADVIRDKDCRVVARKYRQPMRGIRDHGGSIPVRLRMGQPMAVHPDRQLISSAGSGYFPHGAGGYKQTYSPAISVVDKLYMY